MPDRNKAPRNFGVYAAGTLFLLLAAVVFAQQAFNLSFIPHEAPADALRLYTLSTLIFVVLLVFGFILLRTLVKVWAERRRGKPGARFKTSLLAMLGILTLLPAISVFGYAYGLLHRNIDRWFGRPIDQIFEKTQEIQRLDLQWQQASAQAVLEQLALTAPDDLNGVRRRFQMKALLRLDAAGNIRTQSADADVDTAALRERALRLLGQRDAAFEPGESEWLGVRRMTPTSQGGALAALFTPRLEVAALSADISVEKANYAQLKQEKVLFRDTYLAVLGLGTVLVLFAAVWAGLFLAKRVSEPIEALAVATREISRGNLDYRVNIQAADELGMLVGSFNDMAARLQGTTTELETRRRYIEVILESVPSGVIALYPDFRVRTQNRAAKTMLGAPGAERLDRLFEGDELREMLSLLEAAEQNPVTREIAFQTPGRPVHSAVTANRLPDGGYVLVVEDLTEVVRAQRASAWRDVARRLAHEIKNPLTPIQLSAERIARNIGRLPSAAPRVSAVVQECVGAIVDEVSSLKNLVDEFVRFARLPAIHREPENVRDLVERTLALYEDRLAGVDLQIDIPASLPLVLMDPTQMKRVLVNLIDNALEALSAESARAIRVACDPARDGTMVRLVIEDTGRGIAPEDRERLFAPYFSTRKDGTGLGLSIASRIVTDHGGYIGAEPNIPKGTRFIIELPVCPESLLSTTSRASVSR